MYHWYVLFFLYSNGNDDDNIIFVILIWPDPPNVPRWLEVVNISKINCDLKWTEPDSDGGSPITNYVVEKRDVRRRAWQAVDTTVKDTKYTVTPLNEGSLYVFRVAAENAVGVSEFCELEDSVLAKDTFSKLNYMFCTFVLFYFVLIKVSYSCPL